MSLIQLILTRKDLRRDSQGKWLDEIDQADVAVTKSDMQQARSVVCLDGDGESKILKDARVRGEKGYLEMVPMLRPFDAMEPYDSQVVRDHLTAITAARLDGK
jgi:hypothetical protein